MDYINGIEVDQKQVMGDTISFLSSGVGMVLNGTLLAALSIANGVVNFGIGFVFTTYILLQRGNLAGQMKRLMRAFPPAVVFTKTMEIVALTEKTFPNFLVGQYLEMVIPGMMLSIILSTLQTPYALLIGVLAAFTALIPIFGALIGCVADTPLMPMVSPVSAVIFVIIFPVLQQAEGSLIYPHAAGSSVGLPSIQVPVAATLGDSTFGVVGMLVSVPLYPVFYPLLRQGVNKWLNKDRSFVRPVKQMTRVKKPGGKS